MKEKEVEIKEQENKEAKENKTIGKSLLEFLITTLNGMAYGLFATLIIGTIINTIGGFFPNGEGANKVCAFLNNTICGGANVLQILTGAGIGVGIALALKLTPLQTIVAGASGQIAAYFALSTKFVTDGIVNQGKMQVGDPLTIYLVVIAVVLAMKYVLQKKTPVDILIVPLFGITVALIASLLIRFPAIYVTFGVQWLVNSGTNTVPFVMGIIVAVIMGMALTAPISSAAIAAMVFTLPTGISIAEALVDPTYSGLVIASGAAIIGCSCQMVGFAIQSR
ncbi:MAG: PTS sugar transporter subunit IIC, partial [Bacilli bacterium]|nr:PTS sugar transporter subunit IIC [Bacilli bacterium]